MNEEQKRQLKFDVNYLTGITTSKVSKTELEKTIRQTLYMPRNAIFLIDLLVEHNYYPNRSAFFVDAFYDYIDDYQELMFIKKLIENKQKGYFIEPTTGKT